MWVPDPAMTGEEAILLPNKCILALVVLQVSRCPRCRSLPPKRLSPWRNVHCLPDGMCNASLAACKMLSKVCTASWIPSCDADEAGVEP